MRANKESPRVSATVWTLTLVLAAGITLLIVAAMGNNNLPPTNVSPVASPTTTISFAENRDPSFEIAQARADSSNEANIEVTDTTLAPAHDPEPAQPSATTPADDINDVTASTTPRPATPPWVSHPIWDHRLPSTWGGLGATRCFATFDDAYHQEDLLPPIYASEIIEIAFTEPAYEPEPGTRHHYALVSLGVSSTQDLRDMGRETAEIRWTISYYKTLVRNYGDLDHPECAEILEGANAALTPITTTTTTP